jgi:hypothetical protein
VTVPSTTYIKVTKALPGYNIVLYQPTYHQKTSMYVRVNLNPALTTHSPHTQNRMYTLTSRPLYSLAIPLILLLALICLSTPVVAQNPIANAYYCRMRCDASFSICVNTMGKSSLRQATLSVHPISSNPTSHSIFAASQDFTPRDILPGRTSVPGRNKTF